MRAFALVLLVGGCAPPVVFQDPSAVLDDGTDAPRTANVRAAQLYGDGLDLLVTEPLAKRVLVLKGCPACETVELSDGRMKPVRAQVVDLDGDGDRDLLISDIGVLDSAATDQGRVMLAENDGQFHFTYRTIAEGLQRVACAEAADFDGDGDQDIVTCVFGESDGGILYLSRNADGSYAQTWLYDQPGAILALPFDADGDGDLDIAAVVAQTAEQLLLFRNDGTGHFSTEVLMNPGDPCWGFSGLDVADVDRDGRPDLVVTVGDYMDEECQQAAQFQHHGVRLLRNRGGQFGAPELIAQLDGAYAVRATDLDGDGDLDLVAGGYRLPDYGITSHEPTLIWLRNDGSGGFDRNEVPSGPGAIITLEVADFDGDGRTDVLTGSMIEQDPVVGSHRLALLKNVPRLQ